MSKLHYCINGTPVTDQVITYQKSRKSEDFLPVMMYYDNFKDVWFAQLEDYMDRMTFESEFDFRLFKAVDSFDSAAAQSNSSTKGLDFLGNFNRWFYKILMNWKSNVKTSSFRLKKRPAVNCPICGRSVGRIDEEHLKHYKSVSDLPKYMVWKGDIYEVFSNPRVYAVTWGKKTNQRFDALQKGENKEFLPEKRRVRWPWRMRDGKRGVLCPFTKRIVSKIDDDYLRALPDKYNRYAPIVAWEEFVTNHPTALIQSEIFSIDRPLEKDEETLRDTVSCNSRMGSVNISLDYEAITRGVVTPEFEHTFKAIDKCVKDKTTASILKLISAGYTIEDVCETLELDKKDVRNRMKNVRQSSFDLASLLVG